MRHFTFIIGIFISGLTFGQSDFHQLTVSADSTYGYTDKNPLKMKKGNQGKSIGYSVDFLKCLKTEDNQELQLIQRSTVKDPTYVKTKAQLTNRYTGAPLSGKLGLLDKYYFVTSEKRDTITIYVDIYNRGELKIPKGLKIK
jgi:hypothetical protein